MKRFAAIVLAGCLLALGPGVASAGIGADVGVYFPVGGRRVIERVTGYASFTVGQLAQELRVEEKRGRLVMTFTVTNDGDTPFTVEHRNGQEYEFVVLDKKGRAVYRWSEGMAFTQALKTSVIAPGATVKYEAEIKRDAYKKIRDDAVLVTAFLTDTPYTLSASVPESETEDRGTAIHGAIRIGNGYPHW
ncbi:MAG: hypothetical protein IJS96_00130 [Schwartzia sp.]|nr:hypothetical protein [Schwartzia sp. (in: firmicutes)]